MLSGVRQKVTYANAMSTIAVFVALGGTSYAALTITGKHVKDSSLTGKDVKRSSLTGSDVKNNSLTTSDVKNLRANDFAPGQLPAGPTGPAGPAGAAGARGEPGAKGEKGDPAPAGVLDSSFVYQTNAVTLDGTQPSSTQVNFLSSTDPKVSDGPLKVDQPGQLHAVASVVVDRAPGAGGKVDCVLRMNGEPISAGGSETFSDAGVDKQGDPARPLNTIPIVGSVLVQPGTYNVGVMCMSDRPGINMMLTEMHAVVFATG